MDFSNKLDFLIKLTQIKNKELAAELSVGRSLISLLRTGKRGMPQNRHHIRRMSESFAKPVTTEYQRLAIAQATGLPGLRTEVSADILAIQLERWLTGSIDLVDHILDGIEQPAPPAEDIPVPKAAVPDGETFFFYGDEGRREALRLIMGIIREGMVGVFDNTDPEWLNADPAFAAEVQALTKKCSAAEAPSRRYSRPLLTFRAIPIPCDLCYRCTPLET